MKAKKSLVFFTSLPAVGGHTTSTLGLVRLLRNEFQHIFVIAKEMPGHGTSSEAKTLLQALGVQVAEIPTSKSLLRTLAALKACIPGGRLHRPSSFLAMGMRNLAPVLAFALNAKNSVFYHITHELSPPISKMLNNYGRLFSRVVFISPATFRDFSAKAQKGVRSTWALAPSELNEAVPTRSRRTPGPIRFGFIGRLNEAKGSKILLDFAKTGQMPCELHVAGGGEFESAFAEMQSGAGRASAVTVKYWGKFSVANRHQFFSDFFPAVDYLVVPTQDEMEGIPGVIMESLQFGVPVIATSTGGIVAFGMRELGPVEEEIVRLVPKDQMAQNLEKLVAQPPPSETVSPRCKEYYNRYFADAVLVRRWSTILAGGKLD